MPATTIFSPASRPLVISMFPSDVRPVFTLWVSDLPSAVPSTATSTVVVPSVAVVTARTGTCSTLVRVLVVIEPVTFDPT